MGWEMVVPSKGSATGSSGIRSWGFWRLNTDFGSWGSVSTVKGLWGLDHSSYRSDSPIQTSGIDMTEGGRERVFILQY